MTANNMEQWDKNTTKVKFSKYKRVYVMWKYKFSCVQQAATKQTSVSLQKIWKFNKIIRPTIIYTAESLIMNQISKYRKTI